MARAERKKPEPPRRFRAEVREIGAQGDGVVYDEAGRPAFAPLTAPGDEGVFEAEGDRARLVSLDRPGPDRADPPCPRYGACGACALQHMTEDWYVRWKRRLVVDALERAGLDAACVGPLLRTPAPTRRRTVFGVAWRKGAPAFLGFKERRSITVTPIDGCLVLHPSLLEARPILLDLCRPLAETKLDVAVTVCANGLDVDLRAPRLDEAPRAALLAWQDVVRAPIARLSFNGAPVFVPETPIVEIDGFPVPAPPGGFLQASRESEATLIDLVKQATAGARRIADLFCGAGTFALPLSRTSSVFAADGDAAAVAALAAASAAAQRRGERALPVATAVRNLFERPLEAEELKPFDAVVFDPPRAGARAQAERIAQSGVPRVVAVSCNPATFARDAAILAKGGYVLSTAVPVDQFVYAAHVEIVAAFRRE